MTSKIEKLVLLIVLLCSTFTIKAQENNIIDQVIWIVGEEAILKSDVEESRIAMLAQRQKIDGDPYCFIPEQIALKKLYLDQAKIDSIEIPEPELNKMVSRYEKMYITNAGSKEKLEEYWGMSIHDIRDKLKEQQRSEYITDEVQKKIVGKITLTPSEVRKYYSQLPKDSLPFIETTVEVQILTNEPVIPLKETDIVKGRLRDFTNRINSGETDFATLAILYSEDGAAPNGGEMGFMGRAMLDPIFSNVAFSLSDPNKVSNIVETEYGFHIIQLVERRGDRGNFRHILLRPKVPKEEMDKTVERLTSLADTIRGGAFSFEEAVEVLSFDKETNRSEGLMVNMKQGPDGYPIQTSKFVMEDLPPEIGVVVKDMKVGDISNPFIFKDLKTGKDVVGIVKLKSRTDGHLANVADDYEELRVLVESKKREEILKKWVQRKIRDTYVFIDEEWKGCDFLYQGWIKDDKKPNK